jgi:predicted transcriptional regulator
LFYCATLDSGIKLKAKNEATNQSASILDEEDEATLAAIDRGIQSADEGRVVPLEEVRLRMNRCLTKSSSPKTR